MFYSSINQWFDVTLCSKGFGKIISFKELSYLVKVVSPEDIRCKHNIYSFNLRCMHSLNKYTNVHSDINHLKLQASMVKLVVIENTFKILAWEEQGI